MVLSEGSVDAHAVDRSFVSMSNRAHRMHSTPSRPTPKRSLSGPASASHTYAPTPDGPSAAGATAPLSKTGDEAPFLIASRSIDTLLHLTNVNNQSATWFLRNEARPPKKAKGKDKETDTSDRGIAPLNVLLGLLAKETILSNSQLVDSLLDLISTVTRPLMTMVNKDTAPEGESAAGASSASNAAATSTEMARSDGLNGNSTEPTSMEAASAAPAAATSAATANVGESSAADTVQTEVVPISDQPRKDGALNSMPVIPAERLRNIVKPLATSISSKGFQHTLAIASHLSIVQGARETICEALQAQANQASQSLVSDLDALLSTLPEPGGRGRGGGCEQEG